MKRLKSFVLVVVLACTACASQTRRSPTLEMPANAAPAAALNSPPQRDYLQEAGDTTWRVVTAPARVVAPLIPSKSTATRKAPETFDPPAVMIIPREKDEP